MTLWSHQRAFIDWQRGKLGALADHGMGTGKTFTALTTMTEDGDRSVLVFCPATVLGVWPREVEKHTDDAFHTLALRQGTSAKKAERAMEWLRLQRARGAPHMLVVNYETSWRPEIATVLRAFQWDRFVTDESHRIKAPGGKASKFAETMSKKAKRRLGLSGTPCPHSPLDIYGQARALDKRIFGPSYVAFRGFYAVVDPKFPSKVHRWINQDTYRVKYGQLAHTVKSEDVLDLPPLTHQTLDVELAPQARKAYDQLQEDMFAKVERGEITPANGLVTLLRLQQITGGTVPLDDGEEADVCNAKANALRDVLDDAGPQPVVVFCRFKSDLRKIEAAAATLGRTYAEISGARKDGITDRSEMADGVEVLGVQIQSGGTGIDLTRARLAVYYSKGFSLGDYQQSLARLHRPGQERHVHVVHLVASNTIDVVTERALANRAEVIEAVLYGKGVQEEIAA